MTKKLFITGCDSNTQWMLKWFYENFKKHNPDAELLIWDFGMKNTRLSKNHKEVGDTRNWLVFETKSNA